MECKAQSRSREDLLRRHLVSDLEDVSRLKLAHRPSEWSLGLAQQIPSNHGVGEIRHMNEMWLIPSNAPTVTTRGVAHVCNPNYVILRLGILGLGILVHSTIRSPLSNSDAVATGVVLEGRISGCAQLEIA